LDLIWFLICIIWRLSTDADIGFNKQWVKTSQFNTTMSVKMYGGCLEIVDADLCQTEPQLRRIGKL
jgi:hypothetical protein